MLKKLKFRKIIKICFYSIVIFGFFLLFAELSLRYLLPLPSVKEKFLSKVSQTIGANLTAGSIYAGLFSIEIDNIVLDTPKSNLLALKSIKIRQNPLKLLMGQISVKSIYINEPVLQIVRYQDGSYNFDSLLSPAKEEIKTQENKDTGIPVDLRIKNFNLSNAEITYLDLKDNIKADIKNFNLAVNNFSFYKPFEINFSFIPYFEQKGIVIEETKIALSCTLNLNEMNFKEASLDLKQFLVNYKDTLFKAKTKINNFEEPSAVFAMELENFSNETLLAFGKTPAFTLPLITSQGALSYQSKNSKLDIKQLILQIADTKLNFNGNFVFDKKLAAKGKIVLKSVLDNFENHSPHIAQYKPKGQIFADFDFSLPFGLTGKLNLKDIGFFVDTAGTFENINASAQINNIDDIKINSFEGLLNNNPFSLQASYLKHKGFADVFLDFKADKFYLINTSEPKKKEQVEKEEITATSKQENQTEEKSSLVPLNVNASIVIGKIDVPYIKGNKLNFMAKAQNITSKMDKTHGTFELDIQDGQIKDVYTISNANAITKVMFMSLGIVSRVINTLNVLDLLNGIGKVISSEDKEDGQEDDIIKHQKINGKMDFDSFNTSVDFNQGLATMKKCSFVSDLFSFRVNGNINFDSRNINLNVDSAPGKHTEDGIMPLNIDIKGTIEEPKGSLSVLSSVSALVGDTITNNPVSNMLKTGWSKLFSSDKNEAEYAQEQQEPQNNFTEDQENLITE